MQETMTLQVGHARQVLAQARAAFDAGVATLARVCSSEGRLSNRKLDAQQVASFEMAWAGAELLAAEASIGALTDDTLPLQVQLALKLLHRLLTLLASQLLHSS